MTVTWKVWENRVGKGESGLVGFGWEGGYFLLQVQLPPPQTDDREAEDRKRSQVGMWGLVCSLCTKHVGQGSRSRARTPTPPDF